MQHAGRIDSKGRAYCPHKSVFFSNLNLVVHQFQCIANKKNNVNTFNLQTSYLKNFKSVHDSPIQTEAKYNVATLAAKNDNMSVLPKPCIKISLILFFRSHMNTNP